MGGGRSSSTNSIQAVTSLGYGLSGVKDNPQAQTAAYLRATQIESRINNTRIVPLAPITVELNESTATLRGVVQNDHDRKLLEQFIKLEPGISNVKNELVIP